MSNRVSSNEHLASALSNADTVRRYQKRQGWEHSEVVILADEVIRLTDLVADLEEELQCLKDAYHAKGWPLPEKIDEQPV